MKKEKREKKKNGNKEIFKFVFLFISFSLFFYLIYYLLMDTLFFMRNATAAILGFVFSLCGMETVVDGASIRLNGFSFEIIDECTAIFSSIVYCACIIAYPANLKKKSIGIFIGIPSLYALNLFRLFVLGLVGVFYPNMLGYIHIYLWQATFIIFVVLIFLLWVNMVVSAGA